MSILSASAASADPTARLAQWEAYRVEMQERQARLAVLARDFLNLEDFERAAACASKAEGLRVACARMPPALPDFASGPGL